MRKLSKMIALILCLSLLTSLTSCGEKPSSPTGTSDSTGGTVSTTGAAEPVPTVAEPDCKPLYRDAKDTLGSELTLNVTLETRREVAGEVFTRKTTQTIHLSGYGSPEPVCQVEEVTRQRGISLECQEYFNGYCAYLTMEDSRFRCPMPPEDYFERLLPAALIDESLYESIRRETAENGSTTLTFEAPIAGEEWAVPEDAELLSASGTATIGKNGSLAGTGYTAAFRSNTTNVTLEAAVLISPVTVSPEPPEDALVNFVTIDALDGPKMIEYALMDMDSTKALSSSATSASATYAGSAVLYQQEFVNTYGRGMDLMANYEMRYQYEDYTGAREEFSQLELYKDNQYSIAVNGEAPLDRTITADSMENYCKDNVTNWFWLPEQLENIQIEDLGSVYYLTMTGSEALGELLSNNTCATFYGDGDVLDNAAASYKTVSLEAYLSIDKHTGLPTGFGYEYVGEHLIEGATYALVDQWDQAINLASFTAYEAVTGEPMPDTEPENKAAPLFYHVTAPNGGEMWLFGTIHVGDDRTGYLPQEIYDAFNSADALAVEFDLIAFEEMLADDEELAAQLSTITGYQDGTTVWDHLDPELYETAMKLLKASGNYSITAENSKPAMMQSAISNFLLQQSYTLSGSKGVDFRLLRMAREKNMKILDIESGLEQLRMSFGFSDELQELLLWQAVMSNSTDYGREITELYELWCAGDEAALREMLSDDPSLIPPQERELYKEYTKAMSTDRNLDMLEAAIEYLESGETVFYAVGLAHLLAEDGLVNTLRAAGCTVEPVNYAE